MSSIASKGLTRDVERGRWSGKQDGLIKKKGGKMQTKKSGNVGDEKDSEEDSRRSGRTRTSRGDGGKTISKTWQRPTALAPFR